MEQYLNHDKTFREDTEQAGEDMSHLSESGTDMDMTAMEEWSGPGEGGISTPTHDQTRKSRQPPLPPPEGTNLEVDWRRKRKVIYKLITYTTELRAAYGASNNLRRDIRAAADAASQRIITDLEQGPCFTTLEDKGPIMNWQSSTGDIICLTAGSHRFSKAIEARMEMIRDAGRNYVDRWCNMQPLETSIEERQKRGNNTTILNNTIENVEPEGNQGPDENQTEAVKTNRRRARSEDEREPLENSPSAKSSPNKKRNEGGSPEVDRQQQQQPKTKALRLATKKGQTYQELLQQLKDSKALGDACLASMRKTRDAQDAILVPSGDTETEELAERITNAGMTCIKLGGRRKKIHVSNIDGTATVEEILAATKGTRIVYLREGYGGTQTACVETTTRTAKAQILAGTARIGWMIAKIREYNTSRGCFKCGAPDHLIKDCTEALKKCYTCGSVQHLQAACTEEQTEEEEGRGYREGHEHNEEIGSEQESDAGRPEQSTRPPPVVTRSGTIPAGREESTGTHRTIGTQTEETRMQEGKTWSQIVARGRGNRPHNTTEGQGTQGPKNHPRGPSTSAPASHTKTRKTVAIVVSHEGKTRLEVLRAARETEGIPEGGLLRIRQGRAGNTVFILHDGEPARKWAGQLRTSLGELAQVRTLGSRSTVKLRGLDALTGPKEIKEALTDLEEMERGDVEQMQITRMITYDNQEKVAWVRLPTETADRLTKRRKIRVGLTTVRVQQPPVELTKCWSCGDPGHLSGGCQKREVNNKGSGTDNPQPRSGRARRQEEPGREGDVNEVPMDAESNGNATDEEETVQEQPDERGRPARSRPNKVNYNEDNSSES